MAEQGGEGGISQPILLNVPEELIGERVVVRPFRDEDAEAVHAAIKESGDHIHPWLPWARYHETLDDTRAFVRRSQASFLAREDFQLGIFARADGSFLGGHGFHHRSWQVPSFEIGYWLRSSAEGHGYVSEATRLVTMCLFDHLGAQRVMIRCDRRNLRSKAVPERLGYVYEGCLRNEGRDADGRLADTLIYSMTPEDFRQARAAWSR